MRKGGRLGGFRVLDERRIEELASTGVWAVHERTGLQVFHLQNGDEENLFSFSFKTPEFGSTGVAHAIEHSVLCGSERYPLKDPFLQLSNQSVKTYLNALTGADKTMYPASSNVEADYFNLMSVYGDAVFFPKLEKWTFEQEAHRLEVGEGGELCVQGVVYNEMKGVYSSFDSVMMRRINETLLRGTVYAGDSGGDPLCILDLGYEQFRAFHKSHYAPSNCKVFLYGNIPLEKQLQFIEENFLCHFSDEELAAAPDPASFGAGGLEVIEKPFAASFTAPASGEEKPSVVLCWQNLLSTDLLGATECDFLGDLLWGFDGSPLRKALIESGIGEDISPLTGVYAEPKYNYIVCGLRGVKRGREAEVGPLVLRTLEETARTGFSQDVVDATILSTDFSIKEIRRDGGPFSLVLMRRAYRGWFNGGTPYDTLLLTQSFGEVKKRLAADREYPQKLLRRFLLENEHRAVLTCEPDAEFCAKRDGLEKRRLEALLEGKTEGERLAFAEAVRQRQDELHALQQAQESEAALKLIPHLRPADLRPCAPKCEVVRTAIGAMPALIHEEHTNGIVYLNLAFPADVLEPADYRFLSLLAGVAADIGFDGINWAEASIKMGCVASDCSIGFAPHCQIPEISAEEAARRKKADPAFGRDLFLWSLSTTNEKIPQAVRLFLRCVKNPNFGDHQRIRELLLVMKNSALSSVTYNGSFLASLRSQRLVSRACAIQEITNGFAALFSLLDFAEMETAELAAKLERVYRAVTSSGAIVMLTGDGAGVKAMQDALASCGADFTPLKGAFESRDEDFYNLTELFDADESAQSLPEVFVSSAQIGFAATTLALPRLTCEQSGHLGAFTHYLNSVLWEKIRTVGGAYGAFASCSRSEKTVECCTYRDPSPERSVEVFANTLASFADFKFDAETVERIITGRYSSAVKPQMLWIKSLTAFIRALNGETQRMCDERIEKLLRISSGDLHEIAVLVADSVKSGAKIMQSAIISPKKDISYGKTMELPV